MAINKLKLITTQRTCDLPLLCHLVHLHFECLGWGVCQELLINVEFFSARICGHASDPTSS